MIYTVTLNPSVDYIVHVQNVKLGELNRMDTDYKYPGGKGINVSRILHELKSETIALGFIGGFTGEFIEKWLINDGLSTDFTHITGDTRINIKLKSKQETEINGVGPEITEDEASALLNRIEQITKEDTIILSGSKPPSLSTNYYKEIVEIVNQKKAEFVIDTTSKELLEILPYRPLLVKPNLEELTEIFGVKINNREEIIKYGKKLLDSGAKNVIVSMGGDGALLITGDAVYEGISPKGVVQNSVGAGDSLIAGFISRYVDTGDLISSFQFGLASGSATAFSSDLAKGEDILALLKQVKVNQL